ncbi:hypothetical protein L596_007476 [Steinernema carpocapsae]|uniref:Uncharacterized protein n=1 Tax=Steinernema carpocapsae TaxID=34508 RepID=A0A4U5PA25_STECR|nr:hypothetical protein L596_007476 [Steinernema carpocapsae]
MSTHNIAGVNNLRYNFCGFLPLQVYCFLAKPPKGSRAACIITAPEYSVETAAVINELLNDEKAQRSHNKRFFLPCIPVPHTGSISLTLSTEG